MNLWNMENFIGRQNVKVLKTLLVDVPKIQTVRVLARPVIPPFFMLEMPVLICGRIYYEFKKILKDSS